MLLYFTSTIDTNVNACFSFIYEYIFIQFLNRTIQMFILIQYLVKIHRENCDKNELFELFSCVKISFFNEFVKLHTIISAIAKSNIIRKITFYSLFYCL